jgi:hypothetical protein
MANKVIPFPPEKRPPIFTRLRRTIVDGNGTRYALDTGGLRFADLGGEAM